MNFLVKAYDILSRTKFHPERGKIYFFYSIISRPFLWPNQVSVQWILAILLPGVFCRGVKLTTALHVVSVLRILVLTLGIFLYAFVSYKSHLFPAGSAVCETKSGDMKTISVYCLVHSGRHISTMNEIFKSKTILHCLSLKD